MRRPSSILTLLTAVALVLAEPDLPGQGFLLTRTSGEQLAGEPIGIRGAGGERALELATATGARIVVPFAEILGLHGSPPQVNAPVTVFLNGGGELKGSLTGGDDKGDYLFVNAAALGPRQLAVDRVATILFRERTTGAGPGAFALDQEVDEALFRKAQRGFDRIPGALDHFTAEGIMFVEGGGRSVPRLYRYDTLAALSIRGGDAPRQVGDWLLVTASGDLLRVTLAGVRPDKIEFQTEFGPVSLPRTQIAALTRLDDGRQFLSDLEPVRVAEAGSDGEVGGDALMPFRRDRTVSGGVLARERSPADGFLVAAGHTYAKGLGVHSRCVLTYRVPQGMTRFHARVAIDDEVKALGIKGDVDVTVRQGDKVLFERQGLQRGQEPWNVGVLPVQAGALLTLEVGFGKGMFLGDRVDWLSPVFLK